MSDVQALVDQAAAEAGLHRAVALAEPGTELRLPPGGFASRHSYVVCTADSSLECRQRLEAAVAKVITTRRS